MQKFIYILIVTVLIWPVCIIAQSPFQVYFGNLHSHTANSDGEGTPSQAFVYARDVAGLDFLAVTDHVEQIDILEWWNIKSVANSTTVDGTFVALAGYEWGSPLYGHCNQFNTNELLLEIGWFYTNWDGFRQWVIDNPPSLAQFNHPGDEDYFVNWDDFEYHGAQSDSVFPLIEFQSIEQATEWYEFALNKGWCLSPVWNQDNHSANWGTKDDGRAGVWATALNKTALYDAIKKRRTFATMDKNASVWMDVCGYSMGNFVPRIYNSPVHINLADEDLETWANIELVSQNGVIASFSGATNQFDTIIYVSPAFEDWIFIRVTQSDSDMLWSAPVFFTGIITEMNTPYIYSDDISVFYDPINAGFVVIELSENTEIINGDVTAEIITITGQCIKQLNINSNKTMVDISDIKHGVYFVRIFQKNTVIVKKMLK